MSEQHPSPETLSAAREPNGQLACLREECERLREAVRRLEEERRQDAERLRQAERERDEFRTMLYAALRKQFKPEDVVIPDEKDWLSWESFAHELDEIVGKD